MNTPKNRFLILLAAVLTLAAGIVAAACGGKVTLTFVTNGGTPVDALEGSPGEAFLFPETSRGEEFLFDGWYTEADFGGTAHEDSAVVPDSDTTYYAKWTPAYLLTLDPSGGYLPETALRLKEGENISRAVKDLVPQKSGLDFGAWFDGGSELSEQKTMPAGPLTLTAKYTVGYTVEVWLETLLPGSFTAGETVTGRGYEGEELTLHAPSVSGFTADLSAQNTCDTLVLSAAGNVFRFFYTRNLCLVTYEADAPAGAVVRGSVAETEARYGSEITVAQNGFRMDGYRFAGWTSVRGGEPEYRPGDALPVFGNVRLYAVWDRGYSDRFGGGDVVYLPRGREGVALLDRGGVEFEGTVNGTDVSFPLAKEELRARLFPETHLFAFRNEQLAGSYSFFNSYYDPSIASERDRLDPSHTLTVDEYGNAVHVYSDEEGNAVREIGEVFYNPALDDYFFTVVSGGEAGDGFEYFLSAYRDGSGAVTPVFSISYGEAGSYYQFITANGMNGSIGSYDVILDGYGGIGFLYSMIEGGYYIENIYSNGEGQYIYKIVSILTDTYGVMYSAGTVFELSFYTIPLDDSTNGFVLPNSYRGEYVGEGGKTLSLDGYGYFADSAVYFDGAETHTGQYSIEDSPLDGVFVTVTEGGESLLFRLGGNGFETAVREEAAEIYYLLDGGYLLTPLIAVYGTPSEGGARAVLYEREDDRLVSVAEGVVTTELFGGRVLLYTFASDGRTFRYLTGSVYDTDNVPRSVYYLYDPDDADLFTLVRENGGDGTLCYSDVGMTGMGTVYTDGKGEAYEGSLSIENTELGWVGTFYWVDYAAGTGSYFYFALTMDDFGAPLSYELLPGPNVQYFGFDGDGEFSALIAFVTNAKGDAATIDGNGNVTVRGTYEAVGTTVFGETVYSFRSAGGVAMFDFVLTKYLYNDLGTLLNLDVIYRGQGGARSYAAADGSFTIETDGFYRAELVSEAGMREGTYRVSSAGDALYFTASDGDVLMYEIEGGKLSLLDGTFGTWTIGVMTGNTLTYYDATFDGKGVVTFENAFIKPTDGFYEIIDSDTLECFVYILLNRQSITLRVSFRVERNDLIGIEIRECIVYEEGIEGVYIGENWDVLRIDGYGAVSYYGADGSRLTGTMRTVDALEHFVELRLSNFERVYVLLDSENGTFAFPRLVKSDLVYYSPAFSGIRFDDDGFLYLDNFSGPYFVGADGVKGYLEGDDGFRSVSLGVPGGDVYQYGGTAYYLWKGEQVTVSGKIRFGTDRYPDLDATLSFTPDGSASLDSVYGVLSAGGKSYSVGFTNRYLLEGGGGLKSGPAIYDSNYLYYPLALMRYVPGAADNTFLADGGSTEITMYDYNDAGSFIVKTYVGFGPVHLTEPALSGTVYCGKDAPLVFSGAPVYEIAGDAESGYRYFTVFTAGGKTYSMSYYEETGFYELYLLSTYTLLDGGLFDVGISGYLYSNSAFDFYDTYAAGDICDVTLFGKEDGAPVFIFNARVNYRLGNAWIVPEDPQGKYETGYLVEYVLDGGTPQSAAVTAYAFRQALSADGAYFINLFLGEDGELLVAMAIFDGELGGYRFLSLTSAEATENGYLVHTAEGYDFAVSFELGEEGERTETDGAWVIEVTPIAN